MRILKENWLDIATLNINVLNTNDQDALKSLQGVYDDIGVYKYKSGVIVDLSFMKTHGIESSAKLYDYGLSYELIKILKDASHNGNFYMDFGRYSTDSVKEINALDLNIMHLHPDDVKKFDVISAEKEDTVTLIHRPNGYMIGVDDFDVLVVKNISDSTLELIKDSKNVGLKYINFDRYAPNFVTAYPMFDIKTGEQIISDEQLSNLNKMRK